MNIQDDVSAVLTEMEKSGVRAISTNAAVQQVIESFGVHNEQDPRYQGAMVEYVHRIVNRMFNRYKVKAETDREVDGQLVLPGYERLQQRYLVREGDESVAVKIQDLTDIQLLEKATELRNMGEGCFLHADEIERYISDRKGEIAV